MVLPFIQKKAVGLHIDGDMVRLVVASRIFDHIHVHLFDEEGCTDHLEETISSLLLRNNISYKYICITVDPAKVKYSLDSMYGMDDEYLGPWVAEKMLTLLSGTDRKQEYIGRESHFEIEEDEYICISAIVEKIEVDRIQLIVENAGFVPVLVSHGVWETCFAGITNSAYTSSNSFIVHKTQEGFLLLRMKSGRLIGIEQLGDMEQVERSRETNLKLDQEGPTTNAVYLSGVETDHSRSVQGANHHSEAFQPLLKSITAFSGEVLPERFATVMGLCMKGLYPGIEAINFLHPDRINETQNSVDKYHFIVLLKGVSILLFAILGLSWSYYLYMSWQYSNSEQYANEWSQEIAHLNRLQQDLNASNDRLNRMKIILQQHYMASEHVDNMLKRIPDNVWFEHVLFDRMINNEGGILLSGYSKSENGITQLLQSIEQQSHISRVSLNELSQVSIDLQSGVPLTNAGRKVWKFNISAEIRQTQ